MSLREEALHLHKVNQGNWSLNQKLRSEMRKI